MPSLIFPIFTVPLTTAAVVAIASALENIKISDAALPLSTTSCESYVLTTVSSVSSIPSQIVPVASTAATIAATASALENVTIFDAASPSSTTSYVSPTVAAAGVQYSVVSNCKECTLKEDLIKQKDAQIKDLRNRLKKTQRKLWYLQKVKEKLNKAFLKIQNESIANEELYKYIEVF